MLKSVITLIQADAAMRAEGPRSAAAADDPFLSSTLDETQPGFQPSLLKD